MRAAKIASKSANGRRRRAGFGESRSREPATEPPAGTSSRYQRRGLRAARAGFTARAVAVDDVLVEGVLDVAGVAVAEQALGVRLVLA